MLPKRKLSAGLLVVEAFLAGLLEALLLVLVVSAAVAGTNDGIVDLDLPLVGELALGTTHALLFGAAAGLIVLGVHAHASGLTAQLSASVLRNTRDRVMTSFTKASWAQQAAEREGSLQETMSSFTYQAANLVVIMSALAASSLALFALLLVAFVVDPIITLVVLILGGFLFIVLRPVGRMTRRLSRNFVSKNSAFAEQVAQASGLAMELRIHGVADVEAARLSRQNRITAEAFARSRLIVRLGGDLYKDVAILLLVGAIGIVRGVGSLNLGRAGAVVILVVRCLSYAQRTNVAIQQLHELEPSVESLTERLASLDAASEQVGGRLLAELPTIELIDVGYDYEFDRPGVDGVTIDIAPGESLGVIGPSGAGKTTLVQLLLRLRRPTRGAIKVGGVPYEEIDPSSWHRLVALVPQEPKLFEGSVAENITFHRAGLTRERVEQAAAAAHVADDIIQLPSGFDTMLGPRGTGLSVGQKQRIAIARALAGEPQLLVLDEPTSALDLRSEELLLRTIQELKGHVTLVIVAHRLSTLVCCDRVIGVEGGRVKVIGTLADAQAAVSLDVAAIAPLIIGGSGTGGEVPIGDEKP